ncbi:hypothetical protein LOTGIDRAFT_183760 [Lottia gigantea]|uniref:DNA-directed RNA polymerase III subunit RPC6 n=1 Tax=Lottia gigantea TaxID=225164 RepID=V3ZS76_LOTGI|nr:hypothetical protein LOTGIDRAFT_183760 [Lottia gigantea]ESO85370.1 hypothetical protein LOTGIDRAFT_183760 [Lottia gigantea]
MEVDTAVEIKQEPIEGVDLETRILNLCHEKPGGINEDIIKQDMPQFDVKQRVTAINRLLSTGKLEIFKSGTKLIYKLKDGQSSNSQMKGADNQEKLVYQIIKEAENKGIWIRDIRYKSNLLMTQLNKILKNLESKKLIKAVKSVAASKKKVYMLYNLEPDRSVTGGAWYSDQDFESEFVEVLNQQCLKYLQQRAITASEGKTDPVAQKNGSYASSQEIWKFISQLGISKVQLAVEDIETILDTLIYDGKVERAVLAGNQTDEQRKLYRSVKPVLETTGLMRMPCGSCPVFDQCHDGGAISPTTCVYMKDWLS